MRMSEFWELVDGEFGPGHGRPLVHDHVIGALGHRTAYQVCPAQAMQGSKEMERGNWQIPPSRQEGLVRPWECGPGV